MTRDPNDKNVAAAPGGEEALIAEFWAPLAAGSPGAYGLEDDCATLAPPPGEEIVVTTDALIAGVHFFPGDDPGDIGWKALAVNVSDLVAKGATPLAYLMSVALPALDRAWLQAFTAGLKGAQEAFACRLIGGDTDRTPGPLTVTIAAFGTLPAGSMVRRATARPGDLVYVSGSIGDAALGLAIRRDPALAASLDETMRSHLEGRFSRPYPPVELAPALRACASAAMDISDGLMKDFDRLCRASAVGGRIEAARLPLSDAAHAAIAAGSTTLVALMTGGEDYEVLATVPPERAAEFERLAAACGIRVTRIGAVTTGALGATAIDASGAAMIFAKPGWDHFSQP